MKDISLLHLEPKDIWFYFFEICKIPRPSKQEKKIIEFLRKFAEINNLNCKVDKVGNVLITKPAYRGCENRESIVLQSHLDMVCEKNASSDHNFLNDAITPFADGEWVKAKDTTLGADDGIGIAAQLAVLASKSIKHGPLECLFTVDEETGLSGASALQKGFFNSKYLINLDSEDEGELFIGCAGGIDTLIELPITFTEVPQNYWAFELKISGLSGGHSGDDIDKGRANANKLLGQYLYNLNKETDIYISEISGGNLRNAIPRESRVIAIVPYSKKETVRVELNLFIHEVEVNNDITDENIRFDLESVDLPFKIFSQESSINLIKVLNDIPNGVLEMSKDITDLVETSTNLASIKMLDDKVLITTSQRSSSKAGRDYAMSIVAEVFHKLDAKIIHSDGYPGWKPNMDSLLLKTSENLYQKLFKYKPKVRAIHAGLECGLFLEKYPYLDMISFGPTIKGAHSPDERLSIPTVEKFWKLLIEVLETQINEK